MDTGVEQKLPVVSARRDDRHSPQGSEIFDLLLHVPTSAHTQSYHFTSDIGLNTSTDAEKRVAQGCALNFTQNLLRCELAACD